jgi:hypothetical protein
VPRHATHLIYPLPLPLELLQFSSLETTLQAPLQCLLIGMLVQYPEVIAFTEMTETRYLMSSIPGSI